VTALYAAAITLLVSLVIVAIALFVSSKRLPSEPSATSTIYRIRSVYFFIILAAVIVALAFTLPMTPYPKKSGEQKPDVTVKAIGEMWSWSLAPGYDGASAQGNLVLTCRQNGGVPSFFEGCQS
jgi:heme/copper-type cytochrome/quinol oxidase subunit 2